MIKFEGAIEAISGRIVSGSLEVECLPERPVVIEFLEAGRFLGSAVAQLVQVPGAAGVGPLRLKFEFLLPEAMLDGEPHEIAARVDGADIVLRNNLHWFGTQNLTTRSKPKGWLEQVSDKGLVLGWAWYPDRPDARVELEIVVDGHVVGTTVAANFRKDILDAGFGDGKSGFSWPLPHMLLLQPKAMTVSVRDKISGESIGKSQSFQMKLSEPMQKISELEHDLRLLQASVSQVEARRARDELTTADLFQTVGDFFAELAAASEAGQSVRHLRTLKAAVADVTTGFSPFSFRPCIAPKMSVFVEAAGPVNGVYETLRAIFETLGTAEAEVFLLDTGACDDAPLLPLVVQNMRYARLAEGGAVAHGNDVMRLAAGEVVVMVAAGVRPGPFWVNALARFEHEPALAAMAAQLTGADGLLLSAGIVLRGQDAVPRGEAQVATDAAFAQPSSVDSVTPEMFALRRAAWSRLGGFDGGFYGLRAALVEYCLRLKASGDAVTYEPGFGAALVAASEELQEDVGSKRNDFVRLHEVIEGFLLAVA